MEVIIEPWPYGSLEVGDEPGRYFQGLVYARDTRNGNNPDSNFYSFPIPFIPVVDYHKRELVRIERLATGGKGDGLKAAARDSTKHPLAHCTTAEYVPELIEGGVRKDLKELSVIQPDGPSFKVSDGSLVEWQKWRFRVSFTAREGVVIHDVQYDNRDVFYRLSISEMVSFCLFAKSSLANRNIDGALRRPSCPIPPQTSFRLWRRRGRYVCKQLITGL
jgi:primary-amine oxidase